MTFGACRRAARMPMGNELKSLPSSRWLKVDFFWVWTYSIGSSRVTTCTDRSWLILSSRAASEVVLPVPVAPVKSTKPLSSLAIFSKAGGNCIPSRVGISVSSFLRTVEK